MLARTVMVQGTASSVGKSIIATALCRIFRNRGIRVAPFKSQNMALNSFVTPDGGEIGRAQAVQAEAAGIEPSVEMNPILLKPERNLRAQVVMLGRPIGTLGFGEYGELSARFRRAIGQSLASLRERYELVVIEGAGSPAEVNLKSRDIVNMYVAEAADAPVVLVGDIDRGGVFAQLVGTMELLEPEERARVAALVVNKFRGERSLFDSGLDFLARRCGKPVLGVVPYIERLRIADEDSVALEDRRGRRVEEPAQLDIAVVRLPAISNYDDLLALEHEPGVVVRFVGTAGEVEGADLVVIPGSKSTVADLEWLRCSGIAAAIESRAHRGEPVLGFCAGCQMLGESIEDPDGVESSEPVVAGLGLLPLRTRFEPTKLTARVTARVDVASFLTNGMVPERDIAGYEIHMGRIEPSRIAAAPFRVASRNGARVEARDGAISADGAVVGTMLHGILEDDGLRGLLIRALMKRKGLNGRDSAGFPATREAEYERLAGTVSASLDLAMLDRIIGLA